MTKPAPIVDQTLSDMFSKEPNPMEIFTEDQSHATFLNMTSHQDISKGRLVSLACGHYIITKALHKARCPRCGEMIRSGYDYDAFRNLGQVDDFDWPDDPLKTIHESSGTFDSMIHKESLI
jgi:hypothetical protein